MHFRVYSQNKNIDSVGHVNHYGLYNRNSHRGYAHAERFCDRSPCRCDRVVTRDVV